MGKMWAVVILIIMLYTETIFAYDDVNTHPRITEEAIKHTKLNSYIVSVLGINEGLNAKFPINSDKTVIYLLRKGSTDEDDPMCRASNHFHNPLLPWDASGLSDQPGWLNVWCFNWKPWYSNITWATGYTSIDSPTVPRAKQNMGWSDARDYFYMALTATNNNDRETYFAKTFQAIGQVLHLLEDMSVPAHTRNDAHILFNYEDWVNTNRGSLNYTPMKVAPSIFKYAVSDPAEGS